VVRLDSREFQFGHGISAGYMIAAGQLESAANGFNSATASQPGTLPYPVELSACNSLFQFGHGISAGYMGCRMTLVHGNASFQFGHGISAGYMRQPSLPLT
jgi:hypothetical protein